jgi:micrococcal nuclease
MRSILAALVAVALFPAVALAGPSLAVRVKGVAAPEISHVGRPAEPSGIEAKRAMQQLVDGKTVVCKLTRERSYQRRIGSCRVGDQDVGEAIIAQGLARDCPRYSGGFYARAETPGDAALTFPHYCVVRRS